MKAMRTFIIVFFCVFSGTVINAQPGTRESSLLFENFTPARVLFKNKSVSNALLNYDLVRQEMLFLDGEDQMILQELHTIDTIYIEGRKFIPQKNVFLEKIESASIPFYIEWKVSAFSRLKEEGMGLVSQEGSTEALNISRAQNTGAAGITENIVYTYRYNNTYYLPISNKLRKFSTIQGFIKLYPKERSSEIQSFVTQKNIHIQQLEDVIELIEYTNNREIITQ